ncbi:integral peroxisomal membrane peroxin-domain-containing protein [Sphaerosporella brunnea]|uniref:Integral peroxisomal membrane peroxin-domain-containing protein n=1 Tax=Sphaerosporella brunnea TaxID=1250544 RepID=A0A5J5F5R9_9PEZI|nr:integral peroxisomal membrane peroxin-domain-containing protein [Sphaerosporella brunnea]
MNDIHSLAPDFPHGRERSSSVGSSSPHSRSPSPQRSSGRHGWTLGLVSHTPHRRSYSGASASAAPESNSNTSMSTSIQERVFQRMLQSVLPSDFALQEEDGSTPGAKDPRPDTRERPPFSLTTMSQNFRRFNSRIGIVFIFQHRVLRLLSWKTPSHTLSLALIYTFVCLDPYLIFALPATAALLFLMVPSFITRHPPAPNSVYTASGPAIAPPPEVRAVSEISKDFFRNLRDLQNTMDDFTVMHDKTIALIGPPTNFSDEKLSSGIFLILFFTSIALFISAHLLPWRLIFLVLGWTGLAFANPSLQRFVLDTHDEHLAPKEKHVALMADSWIHRDITLSTTPETREVEVFELQRRTPSGEYEPWLFSNSPYEPLSPARIAEERPKGTRFFEDVRVPPGWEWVEGKWTLDLGSTTWVAERCVVGVEVEEEGERWVFDHEHEGVHGEWRRRRWVRTVRRKYMTE